MPIIKDKYGAKGSQSRSKFVTRKENPAIVTETVNFGLSTDQVQEIRTQQIRNAENPAKIGSVRFAENENNQKSTGGLDSNIQSISGFHLTAPNTLQLLSTITKGESIDSIIIQCGATANINLFWSVSDEINIVLNSDNEIITTNNGSLHSIFRQEVLTGNTLTITDDLFKYFGNFNKNIYLYVFSEVGGAISQYAIPFTITIIKH
tara:strand:+ start:136 stop:753 length:618 start_codon:yes stop_codon:yes gene_type:complete